MPSGNGWRYRGSLDDLDYWLKYDLPVIVVLFDESSSTAYWKEITEATARRTPKGWYVEVPRENVIDEPNREALEALTAEPLAIQRLFRLNLAKPWIQAVDEGRLLVLRFVVFTNKVVPRGSISLLDKSDETPVELSSWFFLWGGFDVLKQQLQMFFPWASFPSLGDDPEDDMDREFYLEDLFDTHHGVCAEGEVIMHTMEWDDFVEQFEGMSLDEIKAQYDNDEGFELTYELALSEVGRAFLRLDEYLSGDENSAE